MVAVVTGVTAVSTALTIERRATRSDQVPIIAGDQDSQCGDVGALREQAGVVLVVGLPGVTRADDPLIDALEEAGVGGVMLRGENLTSRRQAAALVAGLRRRLGTRLLVAVDEEGGRVTSLRALDATGRSARRLGRAGPEVARAAGEKLGELAVSIGIDWVLGPVVDLDAGPSSGVIGDRSFGANPYEVADVAAAYADGLRASGVAVTLKHFPGHGSADSEPHAGTTADHRFLDDLERTDLVPFDALIGDDAESVMVGHVIYPFIWGRIPASLSPGAYELLRQHGFDGVAITDALGMGAVYNQWGFDRSPAMALDAGADAVLVTQGDRVAELRDGIERAVIDGRLDETRLGEAVRRMRHLRGEDRREVACA